MPRLASALFVLLVSCAPKNGSRTDFLFPKSNSVRLEGDIEGPDYAELDVWRPRKGAEKIYVAADPGDGVERLFLLDTGAAISVVSLEVAQALALETEDPGHLLVGLGGQTAWNKATLDELKVGPFTVTDVDVAVDVPGVPTTAGLAPVHGILGNNVWGHFQLAVDYPADVLELARPGTMELPRYAEPIVFDGEHVTTAATLMAEREGTKLKQTVLLEIDTGARGLIVDGVFGNGLEVVATEGEEPIFGVGAGDSLPASQFMRETRRVPITAVEAGGRVVRKDLTATWINYDQTRTKVGPMGMPGLLGHQVMSDYRMILDFPAGYFALVPSEREPRQLDMHERYLATLKAEGPGTLLEQAEVLAWLDRVDEGRAAVQQYLEDNPDDPRGHVLHARILRHEGKLEEALEVLVERPVSVLLAEHELVGTVNALWLQGRIDKALEFAGEATDIAPESAEAWVALTDARRASGDLAGARQAIAEANRIDENPDGHLLRRAWIASEEGDTYAAITYVRRLMRLYPAGGVAPWFYALEVAGTDEEGLFRTDLGRALQRIHPGDLPFDFLAAAYAELGDPGQAQSLVALGRERDCASADTEYSRRNCEAWYLAMSRQDLEQARAYIDVAIAGDPNRPEFLDTLAVVLLAQGQVDDARTAARRAASLLPDDVYLLWQAARMDAMAQNTR